MDPSRLSNRRLKEIRSLTRKKYRERYGETLAEGVRAVESALDAGADVREVLVTSPDVLAHRAVSLGDRLHVVEADVLENISDVATHQGVAAVVGISRLGEEALTSYERVLALDRLRDPGNAGTLVRSAAWFGIEAVITGRGTVDLYNQKVVRSAMGGLWDVDHVEVDDLASVVRRLRKSGFTVYGADMHGAPVDEWEPILPSVLVLGSEAHGISDTISGEVDVRVLIPGRTPRGGTESLNVAVAAGILMYEWTQPSNHARETEKA